MSREATFAVLLLLALPSCADVLAPLPAETATSPTPQLEPASGFGEAMPVMTEEAWSRAEPGWRWVHLPVIFSRAGDRQEELIMAEVQAALSTRDVRAVRVEGDFAVYGTCFDGEPEMRRATTAHEALNVSWGGVAITRQDLVRVAEVEAWVAEQFTSSGVEAVRVGPRVSELIEVAETPEESAFRPRVGVSVLVPDPPTEEDTTADLTDRP